MGRTRSSQIAGLCSADFFHLCQDEKARVDFLDKLTQPQGKAAGHHGGLSEGRAADLVVALIGKAFFASDDRVRLLRPF